MELSMQEMRKLVSAEQFQIRLKRIEEQVAAACAKAGRSPDSVRIVGVTKTIEPTAIPYLLKAGVREFGENRWQHAREMLDAPGADEAVWHFIGHLQSNKVKYVVGNFSWIHSVESVSIVEEISRQSVKAGVVTNCLVQVNVSGEESKFGVSAQGVPELVRVARSLPGVAVRGLMTMAPKGADDAMLRRVFGGLRELLERIRAESGDSRFCELSMGMSEDFSVAVEAGATMIRLGRSLMESQREL